MRCKFWLCVIATLQMAAAIAASGGPAQPVSDDDLRGLLALADSEPRRAIVLAGQAQSRFEPAKYPAQTLALVMIVTDASVWLADYTQAIESARAGLLLARLLDDRETERRLLLASGFSHQYRNEEFAALRDFRSALSLAKAAKASRESFDAHLLLAGLLTEADLGDLALKELTAAEALLADHPTMASRGDLEFQRAATYRSLGDFDRALTLVRDTVLADRSQPSNDVARASSLRLLGAIHLDRKSPLEALAPLQQALDLFARAGSTYNVAVAARDLGSASCLRGAVQVAEERFATAKKGFDDQHAEDQRARLENVWAACLNLAGRHRDALVHALAARKMSVEGPFRQLEQIALGEAAKAYAGLGQWRLAATTDRELADLRERQQVADRSRWLALRQVMSETPAVQAQALPAQTAVAGTTTEGASTVWLARAQGAVSAVALLALGAALMMYRRAAKARGVSRREEPLPELNERADAIAFLERWQQGRQAAGAFESVTFAMVAIRALDDVNRRLGWEAGDAMLIALARRLVHQTPRPEFVARLSGNRIFAAIATPADVDALRWIETAQAGLGDLAAADGQVDPALVLNSALAHMRQGESAVTFLERLDNLLRESEKHGAAQMASDASQWAQAARDDEWPRPADERRGLRDLRLAPAIEDARPIPGSVGR